MVGSASHEIPDHLWETKIVFTKISGLKRMNQDGELRFPGITLRHWVLGCLHLQGKIGQTTRLAKKPSSYPYVSNICDSF
jgi:hypothetical protein